MKMRTRSNPVLPRYMECPSSPFCLQSLRHDTGARGSVVGKAQCYKPTLPAALGPGVYSAPNRNEYQNIKIITFLECKVWRVRRVDNLTAICEPIV
jgi:hypothetical protein